MPFHREHRFDRCLAGLGRSNAGWIDADILDFEGEYHASQTDDDIPGSYNFKLLKNLKQKRRGPRRPWKLHQIYVGGGGFRAILMFLPGRAAAWWVYAFKKERQSEPHEIEHAEERAGQLWAQLQGDKDVKK